MKSKEDLKYLVPKYNVCLLGLMFYCDEECGMSHLTRKSNLNDFFDFVQDKKCEIC